MILRKDPCTTGKQLHRDCYGRVSKMSIYGLFSSHYALCSLLINNRPVYLIGLLFEVPMTPIKQYLTLSLRDLQFSTFQSNLLAVPWNALHIVTMLGLSYTSEIFGDISLTAIAGQIWALPFLFYLLMADAKITSRWAVWGASTLLLSYPNGLLAFFMHSKYKSLTLYHSSPHPSQLGQSKLQLRPLSYRLRSVLQHVCASWWHYRLQHIPCR
jgi:hypothetical protein